MNVGELTLDVGETTSYVGELVVGELTRWRNDRHSLKEKAKNICYSDKGTTHFDPRDNYCPISLLQLSVKSVKKLFLIG